MVSRLADFGWRCPSCAHEWGFEVLTDRSNVLARDVVGNLIVSTVRRPGGLGISLGRLVEYETAVFKRGDGDELGEFLHILGRYDSEETARAEHSRWIEFAAQKPL